MPSEPTIRWIEDVDGVVEIDQRVDRIADGVLDPVFVADQRDQLGVGHRPRDGAACSACEQVGVALRGRPRPSAGSPESSTVPSISISAQPVQRVVGVVGDAAAHAGRVVVDDAADLAGRLAGGIRPELAVERLQRAVGVGDDDGRAERDAVAAVARSRSCLPAIAEHGEHAVGDRLAARARCRRRGRSAAGFRRARRRCTARTSSSVLTMTTTAGTSRYWLASPE